MRTPMAFMALRGYDICMTERGRHYASTWTNRFFTANPIALAALAVCGLVVAGAAFALAVL